LSSKNPLDLKAKTQLLYNYDKELKGNFVNLVGIDEAGRGPLAGPVVAAAVILPLDKMIVGINDSKQLSAEKRDMLYNEIIKFALDFGIGIVGPEEIDRINIYQASKQAMIIALSNIKKVYYEVVATDYMKLIIPDKKLFAIVKGDTLSANIAAASIIAKVTRDRIMIEYDKEYPGYAFSKNKGYPTPEHKAALIKLGLTPIHRRTFAPVKNILLF
jgi:ribonuclease HII